MFDYAVAKSDDFDDGEIECSIDVIQPSRGGNSREQGTRK